MNTALIVIDMQNDYLYEKRKPRFTYDTNKLVGDVNALIHEYRDKGCEVIYIRHIIQDLSSQPEYRFQLPLFPALLLLLKKRMADDVFHFHIWQKERNFHSFQPVSLSTAEIVAHIDDEILHIGYDRIDTQTAPVTQFVDSKF